MRYWWVNQKKTNKFEIPGGFMWSPKRKRNGARNQFYDNMRETQFGDVVFSYFNQRIGYIGRVAGDAVTALMPKEFGDEKWQRDGWYVPVDWHEAPAPLVPVTIRDELTPLLPSKYSPLNRKTGLGVESYLSEVPVNMADRLLQEFGDFGRTVRGATPDRVDARMASQKLEEPLEDAILNNTNIPETERIALQKARRGQGRYRQNLANVEKACRVTGITDLSLLIASHAKPWSVCADNHERLDGYNGLLLAPHIDFLFDRGLIAFEDSGKLKISPRLSTDTLDRLGLDTNKVLQTGIFHPQQLPYIRYHREEHFKHT